MFSVTWFDTPAPFLYFIYFDNMIFVAAFYFRAVSCKFGYQTQIVTPKQPTIYSSVSVKQLGLPSSSSSSSSVKRSRERQKRGGRPVSYSDWYTYTQTQTQTQYETPKLERIPLHASSL
jgi:6-phosphogluconolactonase (cycloisomerase 2 family)